MVHARILPSASLPSMNRKSLIGEWFPQQGGWREARPDAPLRLAFSFESDRSDYDFPERRRPRSFVHGYIFGGDRGQVREQYYWDPEKWEADWRKTQPGK